MKYLCLDIGNVLCHTHFKEFIKVLSKHLNISLDEALYFMNRTQKLHDLGLTYLSDELKDHFKIHSPVIVEEILKEWDRLVQPAELMINTINNLQKTYNLNIALLSNIGLEHAETINYKLMPLINNCIKYFSCEVGARKPHSIYYQNFLLQFPEFQGAVYLDDLQENLDASKKFGFQTFKFALSDYYKVSPIYDLLESDEEKLFNLKISELENLLK